MGRAEPRHGPHFSLAQAAGQRQTQILGAGRLHQDGTMTELERLLALERIRDWFKAFELWFGHLCPSDRAIVQAVDELIEDVPIEIRSPEEMPWKCAERPLVPIKGDDNVTHLIASKDFPDLGVLDRVRRELGVKHPLGRLANAIAEGY